MKKIVLSIILVVALFGCIEEKNVKVKVSNPVDFERKSEIVEVPWNDIVSLLNDLTETNVVVKDNNGKEIPSQVIFEGNQNPQKLIFQVDLNNKEEKTYIISMGERSEYKVLAYGRFVPERYDDFAWENNYTAYRVYGPALEATGEISNGIDVWIKNTPEMIVDKWYKLNNYHKDHGEGLDCYKVGRTLGAGAMAPFMNEKIWLGNNFTRYTVLDNGPLRVSFRLEYAPFDVDGNEVKETRVFTLDGDNYFNKIEETYTNAIINMQIAAGIVLRSEPGELLTDSKNGLLGYWEPQNNDNNMNNGHTVVGVIFPDGAQNITNDDNHLLMVADYKNEYPFVYFMGASWSKSGISSASEWFSIMRSERNRLLNPLKITVVK